MLRRPSKPMAGNEMAQLSGQGSWRRLTWATDWAAGALLSVAARAEDAAASSNSIPPFHTPSGDFKFETRIKVFIQHAEWRCKDAPDPDKCNWDWKVSLTRVCSKFACTRQLRRIGFHEALLRDLSEWKIFAHLCARIKGECKRIAVLHENLSLYQFCA